MTFLFRCGQRRHVVSILIALAATSVIAGCATSASDDGGDAWVGTITTEGDVTTVVNESGSVWGGRASLVEEASIGVDAGEDPYMFGQVTSVWATGDEIYVVDEDVPAVRVYDRSGTWLRDIGGPGQGPGEYQRPYRVARRADGTIFVSERGGVMRILVYDASGEYLDTWTWTASVFLIRQQMVVTHDGTPYLEAIELERGVPTEEESRYGMQAGGPEGKVGAFREFPRLDVPDPSLTYMDGRMVTLLPFAPVTRRTMLPSGALVYGVGTEYRITIESIDGAKTIVERRYEPVAILPEERAAHEHFLTARIRSSDPGWTWSGRPIPEHKPAFEAIYPARDDRLLLSRKGTGLRIGDPDCAEDPTPDDFLAAQRENRTLSVCWRDPLIWDVFGPDGRYLGELEVPDVPVVADPFLDGDTLVLAVEDEAGIIRVKRYRVELPE